MRNKMDKLKLCRQCAYCIVGADWHADMSKKIELHRCTRFGKVQFTAIARPTLCKGAYFVERSEIRSSSKK